MPVPESELDWNRRAVSRSRISRTASIFSASMASSSSDEVAAKK
jgi:hypothetical protein